MGLLKFFNFIKNFKVTKGEGKYINTTIDSEFLIRLFEMTELPLRNYYLTETQIRSILNYIL